MIITDDCSSDQTIEIIKSYQQTDERIKLIQLAENSGSAIARNTSMDHASGSFLAFLDSGDQWLPDKLVKQLDVMLAKDTAFAFTNYVSSDEDCTETNESTGAHATDDYNELMKHCVIGCLTVMLDKDKIGNERMINIRTRQDYVFWLTIMKTGFLAYGLPEVLAKYRLVEGSISSNKVKAAKQNWYVYRHIEKQSILKSSWYFLNYAIRSVVNVIKFRVTR